MVAVSPSYAQTTSSGPLAARAAGSAALLVVFMITLLIPISFEIAGVRLSPNRLFLLISIVPFAVQIVSGQIGRFTAVDLFFLLHGVWIFVALIAVHGTSRIPFAGITAVELVGGYFVGRALITNAVAYRHLFIIVLAALIVLLPFAMVESFTGKLVIPDLLRPFFDTPERARSAYGRMGLERVYAVFDHPILWGLFCALTLANFIALAKGNKTLIAGALALTFYSTMLSLSSAPLIAWGLQLCLLAWGWMMGGRWKILFLSSIMGYVFIDLLSDRTPVTILIDTLTFNPFSGYVRIAIFDSGWAAAKGSPIFGIGFNDWARPGWVTSSVDNFWLLTAMRYGMVGAAFLIIAFGAHFWALTRARVTDPQAVAIRVGHTVALVGISFTLVTVHVWGTLSVFVMFYLGAGAWLYAYEQPDDAPADLNEAPAPIERSGPRYSRFAPRVAANASAASPFRRQFNPSADPDTDAEHTG